VILAAMRVDPDYRSAMSIRHGDDILQACQAAHLHLAPAVRPHEPVQGQGIEGSPRAPGRDNVPLGLETAPDILCDLGATGKEALVWVLGHDAVDVARKVLLIRRRFSAR
jgi:predicted fused transcriptional regulator/phosphomethylpyrimidine kinase